MAEDDFGFQPRLIEGERYHNILMENPVAEGIGAYRELAADRYRLKAPTFAGNEDVEQFIMEFSDVMEITQWPPRVALLQLRMSLMDKAKPYGLGPNIDSIFAWLQAYFGISAVDARAWLQRLQRDSRTSLQEHATAVMKLAQIAYSDLPQANHERYTIDAFVQSVNDLELHHQFLARGVTTVEDALAEGEAYLLANQMHRSRGASHQVEVEPLAAQDDANVGTLNYRRRAVNSNVEGRTTDRHVSWTASGAQAKTPGRCRLQAP